MSGDPMWFECNNLTEISQEIFDQNYGVGWWEKDQVDLIRNHIRQEIMTSDAITLLSSKLCLVHSEVSEALEGLRKTLMDDHLPDRQMFEVELADAMIRILDIAGACDLDIGAAVKEKINYNKNRADHKRENRDKPGGKTI